jgi:2'-5' RNA ligase
MGFSLNIKINGASAPAVTALWDRVGAFEDLPSMRALSYPPHFTFAIYDTNDVSEELRMAAMERATTGECEVRLTFNRIRTFAGPPLVLWAVPEPQDALMRMHEAVHSVIDPALCRPYYRSRVWVPHCTLAMAIRADRHDDAMAFAAVFRGSIEAIFDTVECVTFPPLRVIAEKRLRAVV